MSYSIIFEHIYTTDNIIYSIINPIYNQETIVVKNVESYINNTEDNFELIIILDSCSDNTKQNLLNFITNYKNKNKNFIQIKILETLEPLFETKCDNIGFKIAQGKYLLEIQADMEMTEIGYNKHLSKAFNILPNVIAVSGRCAHNLFTEGGIGKLGANIEKDISCLNVDKNTFYTFETCNRGPLLLDKEKVEKLGYLDENNYFLDNSEHDLMLRAYLKYKYICGYIPINFNSPLKDGSTRNYIKDEKNIKKKKELEHKMGVNQGGRYLNNYKQYWINLEPNSFKI